MSKGRSGIATLLVIAGGACCFPVRVRAQASSSPASESTPWKTNAAFKHGLTASRGTIEFGERGVTFLPAKGTPLRWGYIDIASFYLSRHRFKFQSYERRGWRLPGRKTFRFRLERAIPPTVATSLALHVGKPSRNADPSPRVLAFAALPAHHRGWTSGTNGVLRFRPEGIDYLTAHSSDSRSWRWADIQTIARPDPYRFTLGGYRETYDFDLKKPMSDDLFDRLWDAVYGRGLVLSPGNPKPEGARQIRSSARQSLSEID
jgi:hypothetical protein